MGEFEISRLFKKHKNKTHTASDGQKFISTVDSVYANNPNYTVRNILLKTIKNKSVVAYGHINLGGTYDFSNDTLSDEYHFKREQLLNVAI